jgi:hypothetical protein
MRLEWWGVDENYIHKHEHTMSQQFVKNWVHHSLKRCQSTQMASPEIHISHFQFVALWHTNLMILELKSCLLNHLAPANSSSNSSTTSSRCLFFMVRRIQLAVVHINAMSRRPSRAPTELEMRGGWNCVELCHALAWLAPNTQSHSSGAMRSNMAAHW